MSLEIRSLGSELATSLLEGASPPAGMAWVAGAPSERDLEVLGIAADGVPTWMVVEGGQVIGMIGLHERLAEGVSAELGYHVDPGSRGRGVAKAAIAQLIAELEGSGAIGLVAEVDPRDRWAAASQAALESNGFVSAAVASLPGLRRFERSLR